MSYRPLRLEESFARVLSSTDSTRRRAARTDGGAGDDQDGAAIEVPYVRGGVAAYCDAQEEITTAVETLLVEDLFIPLQKRIEIEGDGYVLIGEKKEWVYGQGIVLMWGDEAVRAAANKWVFRFRLCGKKRPASTAERLIDNNSA
ncbi:hypothetical protein B0H14DRAFT_3885658 [Mycena olivaceomarginata]|nr:hypothetical protein B0H14DRAFT_3885658 [Mycena olivaceomarginata]